MSKLKPLPIKLNCPREYETVTGHWERSGPAVEDQCAGCGGTIAEHVAEVNRMLQEDDSAKDDEIERLKAESK